MTARTSAESAVYGIKPASPRAPSNAVANLAYTFDEIGNLGQRKDLTQGASGLVETYTYDVLNRLKIYNTTGGLSSV